MNKKIIFVEKCEEEEVKRVARAHGLLQLTGKITATIYDFCLEKEGKKYFPCFVEVIEK